MERTVHLVSLGCAKNEVDAEVMLGVCEAEGWRLVPRPEQAEVIVVNTCSFIGPARQESVDAILAAARMKEQGRCRTLVVAGCLAQRYPEALAAELPEVDHFLGTSDALRLADVLRGHAPRMAVGHPAAWTMRASDPRRVARRPHSVYVKIAEGCNRRCAFCAIPSFRGPQRSRPLDDVVAEVRALVEQGAVEINLVAQDTVAWGRDLPDRPRLASLLEAIARVPGVRWVRMHYLYPESLDERLLALMRDDPRVLPYVDMPLQHASDAMLRRMRRGRGGDALRRRIERIREALPGSVWRTSFIVGHPGETDADFEELVRLVEWAQFDHVGVFVFSPEEGTPSGVMRDRVPTRVARERQRRLYAVQRAISRRKLAEFVGRTLEVLVDGPSSQSEWLLEGRYWGQAPDVDGTVTLANGTAQPGQIRLARVTAAADHDLVADLLDAEGRSDAPPPAAVRRRVRLRTVA
ncbi:MAG: 30S ribosomal protein S12 methylthiotransferase RimO [Myxococcales bacterium]|nr:30S ribosomal protein S12 methylthiotransferase RimO [Myxococcales bacterium]